LNFDANTVGWYQSTYLGSFWNQTFIETQYNYQKSLPQAVVIVYDPTTREAQAGGGPLRAYRLSADFMNKFKDGVFSSDVCATFSAASILENVPVVIKNSYMVNSLLLTLDEQSSLSTCILESVDQPSGSFAAVPPTKNLDPASSLEMGLENYLEKNLEYLGETIEEHSQEQWRWHGWQKNYQKEQAKVLANCPADKIDEVIKNSSSLQRFKSNEPSRLETLIINNQIDTYCNQINHGASKITVA